MFTELFIENFVDQHPDILQRISRKELQELWTTLFEGNFQGTQAGYELFEEVFLRLLSEEKDGALEFRMGGWTLDVSEGLLKSSITTALLAGFLALGDFPALPALVLPAIIPILFDINKVNLTRSEQQILASLTLQKKVRSNAQTPETLYNMLPQNIQRELSQLDFADFLEKCLIAGVADESQNECVKLRSLEQAQFRITVR